MIGNGTSYYTRLVHSKEVKTTHLYIFTNINEHLKTKLRITW